MMDFETVKNNFFSTFNTELLVNQLKAIENPELYTSNRGDYNAYGCEFILNGINVDPENKCWSAADFLEDEFENIREHAIPLVNQWDSWLFYSPSDIRGLLFDFSRMYRDNKILAYDGLCGPIEKYEYEVVREFTVDEFLKEYGTKRLFSVAHWNVTWKNIGYSWNN